jgi:ribulose kinase
MKIKYSPVCTDNQTTIIEYIDENSILVDGKTYEFDSDTIIWDDVSAQTEGTILDAKRVDGELWLTVRRYYTGIISPDWDTGDYHDIKG